MSAKFVMCILYSAKHFVPVQIPQEAEQTFDLEVA
jgi:hypothetical protein